MIKLNPGFPLKLLLNILISCFFLFFILLDGNSQILHDDSLKDSIADSPKGINEKKNKLADIRDLIAKGFHFKIKDDSLKFKGRGPFFSVLPVFGYALQSGYTGAITTSTSFYTSADKKKFSNISANIFYSEYHQYWFYSNSNIFIDKLKLHLAGDWRYYKFPTQTYGIGNHSNLSDALSIDYSFLKFYQLVFREITDNIYTGIGYNLDYHWNIKENSTTGQVYTQIQKYQQGTSSVSSGLSVNFQFDNRSNSINPQGGSYASIQYRPNLTFLGSDKNWHSMIVDLRHYIKFPSSSGNIFALWSYTNLTLAGKPPYLDMPSIGWDDYSNTGRGYVPGRYTGRNLLYLESEYRFELTRNGLLGGVIFGNAESLLRKPSSNLKTIIPGEGFGLRIKLNKFSNTNLAIDYGFGIGGSRGLFFNLGEVF